MESAEKLLDKIDAAKESTARELSSKDRNDESESRRDRSLDRDRDRERDRGFDRDRDISRDRFREKGRDFSPARSERDREYKRRRIYFDVTNMTYDEYCARHYMEAIEDYRKTRYEREMGVFGNVPPGPPGVGGMMPMPPMGGYNGMPPRGPPVGMGYNGRY